MKSFNFFLRFFFCLQTLVPSKTILGQNYNWVAPLIGTGIPTIGNLSPGFSVSYAVDIDSQERVYITGYENDSVDFDPGPGQVYLQGGNDDIFLARYSRDGNYDWAFVLKSNGWNYGRALAIDESDNIYISGYFFSPVDFDPGPGVTVLSNSGSSDMFIAKYTSGGNLVWVRDIGGPGSVFCAEMCSDHQGRIYVAGQFGGNVDFDPGPGTAWLNAPVTDLFFAAYDDQGNFLWVKNIPNPGSSAKLSGLAVDSLQQVYITGCFTQSADFDPGPGTRMLTPAGGGDIFFAKYNLQGDLIWANSIPCGSPVSSNIGQARIGVRDSGQVIIAGTFSGTFDADPGPGIRNLGSTSGQYAGFFASFDSSGNFKWAEQISGGFSTCTGLSVDSAGFIYITGDLVGLCDFDPGPGSSTLYSTGSCRNYFARYDGQGQFSWTRMIGNGASGGSITNPVIKAGIWDQYVAGFFRQTSDFDPGPDSVKVTASSINGFVAKYSFMGSLSFRYDCLGDTTLFFLSDSTSLDSVRWDFGDPASPQNASDVADARHVYSSAQQFNAAAMLYFRQGQYPLQIPVQIHPRPVINLPDTFVICIKDQEHLDAGNPGSTYLWQDGSTAQFILLKDSGRYSVEIINQFGCRTKDSSYVKILDENKLKIPNIITPNSDGKNDFFEIQNASLLNMHLRIYNRWGKLIFDEFPYAQKWNGSDSPDGCYFYLMNMSGSCNLDFKGTVEILR